jgi:hypothetical protein
MTQLLGLGLRKIRQPRVIAEVLGGILLGMFHVDLLSAKVADTDTSSQDLPPSAASPVSRICFAICSFLSDPIRFHGAYLPSSFSTIPIPGRRHRPLSVPLPRRVGNRWFSRQTECATVRDHRAGWNGAAFWSRSRLVHPALQAVHPRGRGLHELRKLFYWV